MAARSQAAKDFSGCSLVSIGAFFCPLDSAGEEELAILFGSPPLRPGSVNAHLSGFNNSNLAKRSEMLKLCIVCRKPLCEMNCPQTPRQASPMARGVVRSTRDRRQNGIHPSPEKRLLNRCHVEWRRVCGLPMIWITNPKWFGDRIGNFIPIRALLRER